MTIAIEDVIWRGKIIIVGEMEFGARKTVGGIIIKNDDMTMTGFRPRMARVVAVGPEVDYIKVGQYVTVEHTRWTHGWHMLEAGEKITVRMVENESILLVSDEPTNEYILAEKM